ncbi:MAG: hypothetical protein N3D11_10975 [Candidatus Sumerlaeia bacterium]|nr:hypothetical protein [Candidatus Sumerlaeia bacterium]
MARNAKNLFAAGVCQAMEAIADTPDSQKICRPCMAVKTGPMVHRFALRAAVLPLCFCRRLQNKTNDLVEMEMPDGWTAVEKQTFLLL